MEHHGYCCWYVSGVEVVATGAARFFSAGSAIVHQVDRHRSRRCTDDAYS